MKWLAKQLAQLHGNAAETAKVEEFDDAMVREVKQFQLAQGLTPDGTVGPQTMRRLNGAADIAAPKLIREQKDK